MPKGGVSHHLLITDRSGNVITPLNLLTGEEGNLMYEVDLARPLAPQVDPEALSYAEFTPDLELPWAQRDWSGGALKFYYDKELPNHYALADKLWPITPHELGPGYAPHDATFGVRNGGGELGATTGWTGSGTTLTNVTTAPYAGTYHIQAASMSTNDYASVTIQQTEQPVARWAGQAVVAHAKVRGTASGGTIRLQIVESGGSSTPTTSGTGVSLTTSYKDVTVAVTLQADSTGVELRVQMSADGGSDRTVYIDSLQMLAGSAIPNASHVRMQLMGTSLLLTTDRAVWLWDETSDYWALQKVHGAAITGSEIYDNSQYVGQGESTAYEYSDAGDPTTTTTSNLASTTKNANRFIKALNINGNWALAKTLNDDEVFLATDPTNSGSWGTAIEVGKDDHKINQVFQVNRTIAVGKEDGLYQYLTLEGNKFANVYPGAEHVVGADNFTRGLEYQGMFYTALGEVGLVRYNGAGWQDLSKVIQSPGFSEIGNRVRGFGTDGDLLYLLVEDLLADSVTKEMWLLGLWEDEAGWHRHTIAKFYLSDALDMMVFKSSGGTNRYLFISGDVNDEAFSYRIALPNRTDTPRLATNSDLPLSGSFLTSYWDGGAPNVLKSFNRIELVSEGLTADIYFTVAYRVDNESDFTDVNSTSSTFTGSPVQTIAFNEGVIGRRIQLRFTMTSNSTTANFSMKSFKVETNWRPRRLLRWHGFADISDSMTFRSVRSTYSPTRILRNFTVLLQETSPLVFEDMDGTSHRAHLTDYKEKFVRVIRAGTRQPVYSRSIEFILTQAWASTGEPWDFWRWNESNWA